MELETGSLKHPSKPVCVQAARAQARAHTDAQVNREDWNEGLTRDPRNHSARSL